MRVTILCRCECSLPANSLPSKNGPWIRDRYRQSRPVPSGVGESYEEVVLVRIGGLHLHLVPGTAFQRQASCCRGGGGAKGILVCSPEDRRAGSRPRQAHVLVRAVRGVFLNPGYQWRREARHCRRAELLHSTRLDEIPRLP